MALIYIGIVVIMMFLETSLVYMPTRYPDGSWQPSNLDFEDAQFAAADGTRLNGWFLPCDHPRAVLLVAHGNGGNLTHRIDMLRELHRLRAAVMIFDYRGYGRSEGSPNEAGILSDARGARAWLAKRAGVTESRVVLVGESLGTGVAVDLAAADGARGLILVSAFTSLPDAAASHYPWLPVRILMRNRLDSLSKIGRYHGPLLAMHGDADRIVPFPLGRRLFDAANEPKRLVVARGSDHNDPPSDEFYKAVDQFLDSL
ncbi:MAG TPA: alpha/beta hydrolase [Pirellulales bacterium]